MLDNLISHLPSSLHPYVTSPLFIPTLVLSLLPFIYFLVSSPSQSADRPPVPPWSLPYLGHSIYFGSSPLSYLQRCRERFGPLFTLNLPGKTMHFLCDPRDYSALFKTKTLSFSEVGNEIALHVLDEHPRSVGQFSKEIHAGYNRALLGPEGLQELITNTYGSMTKWINKQRETRADSTTGTPFNLYEFIQSIVFDAGLKATYGERFTTEGAAVDLNTIDPDHPRLSVSQLQSIFLSFDASFPLLVGRAPSFIVKQGLAARALLIKSFGTYKHFPNESQLIASRTALFSSNPEIYSVHDVGALSMAILWASVANTMPATYWVLSLILRHAKVLQDVIKEIQEHIDIHADGWDRDTLNRLTLLDCCINEGLRLSTGSMVLRKALQDTVMEVHNKEGKLHSVNVKKDEYVSLFPQINHYDEEIWGADVKVFNPYRFMNKQQPQEQENKEKAKDNATDDTSTSTSFVSASTPGASLHLKYKGESVPSVFLPFGNGVSQCPGRFWAKNEIKIFVLLILINYDIQLDSVEEKKYMEFDYSRSGLGVFGPKNQIHGTIKMKAKQGL